MMRSISSSASSAISCASIGMSSPLAAADSARQIISRMRSLSSSVIVFSRSPKKHGITALGCGQI